ncbi:MAG TPA: divalent metal cation transporter FieF [Rhodospirillaceae bacterium]|nr:divalent metal cation transporter FieF [Rhodospirillaceae bacterium]HCS69194.1 divalent metal cation transporter FieF [Rhodospirillaceae bacterium]
MRAATYASVGAALILIGVKFAAWTLTESVSLLSTLIDSMLDALASIVNLIAVHHALQPADREHRFGHGKAEPLAGLAQAAFICGSGAFLLLQAGERLIHPKAITNTDVGYAVMVFSIVVTVALVLFQRYVVRRSGSVAISADSLHYQTDVMINISVIASLYIASEFGITIADPLFAIAIAGYIVIGALKIGRQALDILMDKELADEERARIREIVTRHADVHGMHDLRTRSSGAQVFIQMHVEMAPDMTLLEAHDVTDAVTADLLAAYPNAEIIIHEDPEGLEEDRAVFK